MPLISFMYMHLLKSNGIVRLITYLLERLCYGFFTNVCEMTLELNRSWFNIIRLRLKISKIAQTFNLLAVVFVTS